MSEIPRTYIPGRHGSGPRRRIRRSSAIRRGGGIATSAILAAVLVIGLWALWTTRDTYSMARLIPKEQKYGVFFGRFLTERHSVAGSPVWSLAREDSRLAGLPELLRNDFGLPEWALNHLVYGPCYVSGRNVGDFDDVLFVTKMSRIGCLSERFHRFYGVERDHAGGLALRYIPEIGAYYAVRGRILAVSPSRDAVIRAVTLQAAVAMPEADLERGLNESGMADVYGHFNLDESDPGGEVFKTVRVVLRFESDGMRAALTGRLAPPWEARLGGLLHGAEPAPLGAAPPGMLQISADFGRPVTDVLRGIAQTLKLEPRFDEIWEAWKSLEFEGPPGAGPLVALAAAGTGPGIRLSWIGNDFHEMVPMPILAGDADANLPGEVFAALPAFPEGAKPWEAWPRYDAEAGVAFVPLPGGPALEPALAPVNGSLAFSTSRAALLELRERGLPTQMLPEPGNLYVRIFPAPMAAAAAEAGALLAESGLLRGQSAADFEKTAEAWKTQAEKIAEVSGLAKHEHGDVSVALRLIMIPERDAAP